jgi:hypothetical protein
MTRRLGTLMLAFLVALAMSAITASAAQAVPELTTLNTNNSKHEAASFVGTSLGSHIFKPTGGGTVKVECGSAGFSGSTETGTNKTQLISPSYKECKTNPLELTTDVVMNGCALEFQIEKQIVENMEYEGTMDVVCEGVAGIELKITGEKEAVKCKVEILPQTGIGPIKFVTTTNAGINKTDVDYNIKAENVKNITTGTLANCGVAEGKHETGVYEGSDTVKAFNGKSEQIDLTGMG